MTKTTNIGTITFKDFYFLILIITKSYSSDMFTYFLYKDLFSLFCCFR